MSYSQLIAQNLIRDDSTLNKKEHSQFKLNDIIDIPEPSKTKAVIARNTQTNIRRNLFKNHDQTRSESPSQN